MLCLYPIRAAVFPAFAPRRTPCPTRAREEASLPPRRHASHRECTTPSYNTQGRDRSTPNTKQHRPFALKRPPSARPPSSRKRRPRRVAAPECPSAKLKTRSRTSSSAAAGTGRPPRGSRGAAYPAPRCGTWSADGEEASAAGAITGPKEWRRRAPRTRSSRATALAGRRRPSARGHPLSAVWNRRKPKQREVAHLCPLALVPLFLTAAGGVGQALGRREHRFPAAPTGQVSQVSKFERADFASIAHTSPWPAQSS